MRARLPSEHTLAQLPLQGVRTHAVVRLGDVGPIVLDPPQHGGDVLVRVRVRMIIVEVGVALLILTRTLTLTLILKTSSLPKPSPKP